MINEVYHEFFKTRGLLLDNAYDPFVLRNLLSYYKDNDLHYIRCQDNDLANLRGFKNLYYLTVSQEAYNFDVLSELDNLIGIELLSEQVPAVPENIKNRIESLVLHQTSGKIESLSCFPHIKYLKVDSYPGFKNTDLCFLNGLHLNQLSVMSKYITTLKGIETQCSLECLEVTQCSKLFDISQIVYLSCLKTVVLQECNKLSEESLGSVPESVEFLTVFGSEQSGHKHSLNSLDFLETLVNLKKFETNWKVDSELLNTVDYKGRIHVIN